MKDLLFRLIEIPSVSSDKDKCNEVLEVVLNEFSDFPVTIKKVNHNDTASALVSNVESKDLDVLTLIHLDVVPADKDAFVPKQEADKICGRGSLDMKGSGVVAINVLKQMMQEKTNLKLGILFVTDEEIGGANGAKYWAEQENLTAKIVMDPDSAQPIDSIIVKTKKPLLIKLSAKGTSAHGSRPWLGNDANENMFMGISRLREKYPYYNHNNLPKDEGWVDTLHVGTINGGSGMNIIADYCEAILDFRLLPETNINDVIKDIENLKDLGIDYNIEMQANAISLDLENNFVHSYCQSIKSTLNEEVKYLPAFGATDGRYFADKSIVITHQATGENAHNDGEWVSLKALEQLQEIQLNFLRKIAKDA